MASLRHERTHMTDRAFDHDVEASKRDPAASRSVPLDDKKTAARRGTSRLGSITTNMHPSRHHVLGEPSAGIAIHGDSSVLIHAGAVVAGMTVDHDIQRAVETAPNRVQTARVPDDEVARSAAMEQLVNFSDGP